jgi:hypothetical protein
MQSKESWPVPFELGVDGVMPIEAIYEHLSGPGSYVMVSAGEGDVVPETALNLGELCNLPDMVIS